jgi:hypothetical protein
MSRVPLPLYKAIVAHGSLDGVIGRQLVDS